MTGQPIHHALRLGAFALLYCVVVGSAAPAAARPVLPSACAPGPPVYSSDFEGAIGPEWSNAATDIAPSGRRFLGQFGNEAVTLALTCLPEHTAISLSFDLYLIRSWDGNNAFNPSSGEVIGPDVWELRVDGGPALLRTTFANWQWANYRQAYPGAYPGGDYAPRTGASENDSLGYQLSGAALDAVYRLTFAFPHSGNSLSMIFSASGLQVLADESWGIDNLRVNAAVPGLYLPLVADDFAAAASTPPTGTPTPTASSSPAWTLTPSHTPTATRTATPTPSPTRTSTPTQTSTPLPPSPTATSTPPPPPTNTSTLPPPTSTDAPPTSPTALPSFTPACPIDAPGYPCNTPANPLTPYP
jgi:hypothetical protein